MALQGLLPGPAEAVVFATAVLVLNATPGVDFDRTRGARFLRFSYCGDEAAMAEAPGRLKAWLAR